jgi:NADH:ubiquinone oxidoreductase subunit 6 (subunit J)
MRIGGGALVAVVLLGFIVSVIIRHPLLPAARPDMPGDLTRALGEAVATRYVLPFEMLAVLMLVGMLGAIYFARPED